MSKLRDRLLRSLQATDEATPKTLGLLSPMDCERMVAVTQKRCGHRFGEVWRELEAAIAIFPVVKLAQFELPSSEDRRSLAALADSAANLAVALESPETRVGDSDLSRSIIRVVHELDHFGRVSEFGIAQLAEGLRALALDLYDLEKLPRRTRADSDDLRRFAHLCANLFNETGSDAELEFVQLALRAVGVERETKTVQNWLGDAPPEPKEWPGSTDES